MAALGRTEKALGDALGLGGVLRGCVGGADGFVLEALGGVGGGGLGAGAYEMDDLGG